MPEHIYGVLFNNVPERPMVKYWSTDDLVRYADTAEKPGRIQSIIKNTHKILDWRLEGTEESALIVTDTEVSPLVYHTMAGVLQTKGIDPTISIQPQLDAPNAEPTDELAGGMENTDIIVNMMTYTITHSSAIEHARHDLGVEYILLANATEDTLSRGAVEAEPAEVDKFTNRVADILQDASQVEVTSPHGTDVEMSIEGRDQVIANYPLGETPTCPVEETVNGTIVHDSFMMGVGLLDEPIVWEVEDGRIQEISGGREATALRNYIDAHGDKNSYWIGEFSVMTNHEARPNGNYIEHKEVAGGVHMALGTGTELGGKYRSSIHLDGVQLEPTVEVDGEVILDQGEFTI